MPLRGEYACVEGLLRLFLLLKQFKYEITLEFQQKQGCISWCFCRFHMVLL